MKTTNLPRNNPGASSEDIDRLRSEAHAISHDPRLLRVCHDASFDRAIHAKALSDPSGLLDSREMKIPGGITVEFFEHPPRYLPFPDWTPFVFEFTNCRTYWIRECDDSTPPICLPKEESVCFGFRLYPNLVQPGPVG